MNCFPRIPSLVLIWSLTTIFVYPVGKCGRIPRTSAESRSTLPPASFGKLALHNVATTHCWIRQWGKLSLYACTRLMKGHEDGIEKKTHYKPADTRPRQRDIYCNTQCNISGNYSSRVVNDLQHTAVGMAVVNLGCLSFFWTIIFAITISKKMLHWNKKGFCLFSNIKAFSLNLNDVPSYFLHYWSGIWCST